MSRLGIHKSSVLAYGDIGSQFQSIPSQKQRLHLMRKPSRHLTLFFFLPLFFFWIPVGEGSMQGNAVPLLVRIEISIFYHQTS